MAAPAGHGAVAAIEPHTGGARDDAGGRVHERRHGGPERREPEAVVDELRVAAGELGLRVGEIALADELLDPGVGGHQHGGGRRLVHLAALDPDEPVLDHVYAADAMRTRERPGPRDQVDEPHLLAVDGHRQPRLELDLDLLRRGKRALRGQREGERLVGRLEPRVLQRTGLDRAAPEVVVDRVGRAGLDRHLDAVLVGVGDLLLAGHPPVAHRREHRQVGRERGHGRLEPDLVVALARTAVGHRGRAVLTGDAYQPAADQGP